MDAALFAKIISDKDLFDLKKIKYKYPQADMTELVELMRSMLFSSLPILDFAGNKLVYSSKALRLNMSALKLLLSSRYSGNYGLQAMEDEIVSSFTIESIDFARDSVRRILQGYAPADESENRIYGMKQGLDFISDAANTIDVENIYKLYQMSIGQYLKEDDRLLPGRKYRHDDVYVVGQTLEHTGLPHKKLPEYMDALVKFINSESNAAISGLMDISPFLKFCRVNI